MWFGYYPEIIFCHFFCNLNLVIFKCTIMAGDINSLNLLVSNLFMSKLVITKSRLYRSGFSFLKISFRFFSTICVEVNFVT